MKLISILLFLTSFSSFSQNKMFLEDTLAARTQAISEQLDAVSEELSRRDRSAIEYAIRNIEDVLKYYNYNPSKFVCLSNGEFSSFEKFQIYDVRKDKKIGKWVTQSSCQQSIELINRKGFTCLSNGEFSSFEKFLITNLYTGKTIGVYTSKSSCVESLQGITPSGFTCISNGEFSSFQKYIIQNVETERTIGTWVSLSNCQSTLKELQY